MERLAAKPLFTGDAGFGDDRSNRAVRLRRGRPLRAFAPLRLCVRNTTSRKNAHRRSSGGEPGCVTPWNSDRAAGAARRGRARGGRAVRRVVRERPTDAGGVRFAACAPLARRRHARGPGSIPAFRERRARTAGTRQKSARTPWLIRHANARVVLRPCPGPSRPVARGAGRRVPASIRIPASGGRERASGSLGECTRSHCAQANRTGRAATERPKAAP